MAKINIEPHEVWGYFQKHKDELRKEMHMIAEAPEYGIEIYLSRSISGDGLPLFIVEADGTEVSCEEVVSPKSAESILKSTYENYLSDKAIALLGGLADDDTDYESYERETELQGAVSDMLMTLVSGATFEDPRTEAIEFVDIISDDIVELICSALMDYGCSVYRPMQVVFENGTTEDTNFPYSFE